MKRLILDHFRRQAVLGAAILSLFFIAWGFCSTMDHGVMFWVLLAAMWSGGTFLQFDLQKGLVRTMLSLPLTARQIGRGWWWATVGIPAAVGSVLMILGAAVGLAMSSDTRYPAARVATGCLFYFLWLGNGFSCIYGMTHEIFGTRWQKFNVTFLALLSVFVLFGSMWLSTKLFQSPAIFGILACTGAIVTIASWVRAESFVRGRAGFKLPQTKSFLPNRPHRVDTRSGGIPYFVQSLFIRSFGLFGAMVAIIWLLTHFAARGLRDIFGAVISGSIGSLMVCIYLVLIFAWPILRGLRAYRALPISTVQLAWLLLRVVLLPLMAIGICLGLFVLSTQGLSAALPVFKGYLLSLILAILCVTIAVWCGTANKSLVAISMILLSCAFLASGLNRMNSRFDFVLAGTIVATVFFLGLILTTAGLWRSRHAYRLL